jgi:hypothetical protein
MHGSPPCLGSGWPIAPFWQNEPNLSPAELVGFGIPITAANDLLARRALEVAAGVEFIEENGGGRACD